MASETAPAPVSAPDATVAPPDGAFDPESGGAYDGALYRHQGLASGVRGLPAVGPAEIARFEEDGFLIVEEAFSPEEVRGALDGLLAVIDGQYPAFRGLQFEAGARSLLPTLPRERKQDLIRKLTGFVQYEARLHALATHPGLLALVERLLGGAPGLYENKALIKPPRIGREKPWHQDLAYWNLPLEGRYVTAWIALDPATVDNGCLFVIPGSHRQGPVVHFRRRDWQICDDQVPTERVLAAPLRPGGVLLFDSLLQHGTPANASPQRRRALQFVYVPATAGKITPAARLAVFGSEGKDVTC